jgi:hypothetical protein
LAHGRICAWFRFVFIRVSFVVRRNVAGVLGVLVLAGVVPGAEDVRRLEHVSAVVVVGVLVRLRVALSVAVHTYGHPSLESGLGQKYSAWLA